MEAISEIDGKRRFPAPIRVQPHHGDHCFDGKPVLPAVEAMAALAASVREQYPEVDCRVMANARFDRFLFLPPAPANVDALHELEKLAEGRVRVQLMTRQRAKTAGFTRVKTHASLVFGMTPLSDPRPATDLPEGEFKITAEQLYRDLVPFGSAFQNVCGYLSLSPAGVSAAIRVDDYFSIGTLGAPLVLDGAFHAACAWGQRYMGIVAFPVGFAKRRISQPTCANAFYHARVSVDSCSKHTGKGMLVFDVRIYDENDRFCEVVEGLEMRDVTRGRVQPPAWVRICE